jgi:hypothetical protein
MDVSIPYKNLPKQFQVQSKNVTQYKMTTTFAENG